MTVKDAEKLLKAAIRFFQDGTGGRSGPESVIEVLTLEEYQNEAFIPALSFNQLREKIGWDESKGDGAIEEMIRRMQRRIEQDPFSRAAELIITHSKKFLIVIIGSENVAQYRVGFPQNVPLAFDGYSKDIVPTFQKGDACVFGGRSPIRGWVYLFSIDAARNISAVYPGEGAKSEINVSRGQKVPFSEEINKKLPHPLYFNGDTTGLERLVVVIVHTPEAIPVTCAHMRSRFALPVLFAYEQKTKGVPPGVGPPGTKTFDQLPSNQIAIGTLDYYYEG